jgi:hypothetical protein
VSVALRTNSFYTLKRGAAPGVDGLTWQEHETDLDRRLEDLHSRVHRGTYHALPSKRAYIPKHLQDQMRRGRHSSLREKAEHLNQMIRRVTMRTACSCGLALHRDVNAARNILALAALARTGPAEPNVGVKLACSEKPSSLGDGVVTLNISIKTPPVQYHRARVFVKLNLDSLAGLVRYALRNRLVEL